MRRLFNSRDLAEASNSITTVLFYNLTANFITFATRLQGTATAKTTIPPTKGCTCTCSQSVLTDSRWDCGFSSNFLAAKVMKLAVVVCGLSSLHMYYTQIMLSMASLCELRSSRHVDTASFIHAVVIAI